MCVKRIIWAGKDGINLDRETFFEEFYREHFTKLVTYAKAITKNRDVAQDVVQDAFHTALRPEKMEEFFNSPNPAGWMKATVKNVARNAMRTQNRRARWLIVVEEMDLLAAPEEHEGEDEETVLKGYSEFLSENEMYLLRRLVLDRATYTELEEELGISMWACYKRAERMEEKLAAEVSKRRLLRKEEPKKEKTKNRS